jgi:catechol 2,3-dioxygenase-like lactoylglutathione lyase family enzyme
MSSTPNSNERPNRVADGGKVDMKLEVVVVPVSDVERAKRFYLGMDGGWTPISPMVTAGAWWQITPPGSACSFFFGKGAHESSTGFRPGTAPCGRRRRCGTRRAQRIRGRREWGVPLRRSSPFHRNAGTCVRPRSGTSIVFHFCLIQRSGRQRLGAAGSQGAPSRTRTEQHGRRDLAPLLRETEEHHGAYEASAPKHHCPEWYALTSSRASAEKPPEEAVKDAGLHMAGTRG